MREITFVTSNDNKLREAEAILGLTLERAKLELDELQSMELRGIIEHKAKQAYELLGKPVMVEDAGLYFDAWEGFPGPFIKWMAETMKNHRLIAALPTDNRKATWRVLYCYYDATGPHIAEGAVDGTIATELRPGKENHGWGFDPIFIPDGETRTYAEMGEQEKLKYSARAQALLALKGLIHG